MAIRQEADEALAFLRGGQQQTTDADESIAFLRGDTGDDVGEAVKKIRLEKEERKSF